MFETLLQELERETRSVGRYVTENPTDIKEYEDKYVLQLNAAGYEKENISISYEEGILKITGTMSSEEKEDANEDLGRYIVRERRTVNSFVRRFRLEDVREKAISAKMEKNVLTVTLPKIEKKAPTQIKID